MKALSSLVIAYAIAASIFVGMGNAQDEVPLFSIKSGETLPLRIVSFVTATCDLLYLGFEGIDVMEGPQELSLKFEQGTVHTYTTTRDCPKLVNGGTVMATAKDVTERKERLLTFRVRIKTKQGPVARTWRYRVLLFPTGEPTTASKQ
jgi:hypothetical protein